MDISNGDINHNWIVDSRLIERARETGEAMVVDGKDGNGIPVLVIVIVGEKPVTDFKKLCGNVLPTIATT